MNCEEPGVVGVPKPLEATGSDSARGRSNLERQGWIGSIARQSARSTSIPGREIDDFYDDGTVQHDSEPQSHDVSSELGSDQDEPFDKDAKSSSSASVYDDLTTWVREQPKKLNVKWSDYESFQNRFSPEEGHDIIEVLEGHPDQLRTEILNERAKRRHKMNPGLRNKRQVEIDPKVIYRVRIQSPAVLHILGRLTGQWDQHDWDDTSLTFLRPFQTFYFSLPYAKQLLSMLQRGNTDNQRHEGDEAGHSSPLEHSSGASSYVETDDPLQRLSISSDVDMEDIIYGLPDFYSDARGDLTAVEHMKLYVDFVETYIVPMWDLARGASNHMIRFSDLPMYFRPGDILFVPLRAKDDKNKASVLGSNAARNEGLAVHQSYWKLCFAMFQEHPDQKAKEEDDGRTLNPGFSLFCFHIDFDGDRYGPLRCSVSIPYFEGEVDIRSLNGFPLRFSTDEQQTSKELAARGQNFLSYVQERHLSYDGWTLIHETHTDMLLRSEKRRTEHIDGEIMIDFKEGFQSESGFVKPLLLLPLEPARSSTIMVDPLLSMDQNSMQIQWWSDTSRSEGKGSSLGTILSSESFWNVHSSHMLKEDKVLRAYEKEEMVFDFDHEHLLLFPQRLIAYSFRARKFFVANVDCISFITTPESPFKDLKIEIENKRILKSLVGRHFQKQDIRRHNKDVTLDQDFIRGKGSGLVILLHGVPGVGKTTTAEAVALDNRKPLFALTSGDLGSTPRDVETGLRETFRLAAMWDCVLLLDEADLFLAKRDVGDLVRNSLVSVFLRVLDYYDGVLFLTTNRVGTVDEAFRSRIHLSLYYPPLRRKQAQEIFKLNIRRIKEIEQSKADILGKDDDEQSKLPLIEIDEASILNFATRQWEDTRSNPHRRWNGRQIRNSFQVAYSLVNLGQINTPTSHYDDDYDDEEVDYDDEPDVNVVRPKFQNSGAGISSPAISVQTQKPGKLDSSQFEIVERSIRRFDRYLDRTRGPDSDNAKSKNLRRDDFSESENEDRHQRDHGRYSSARFPPSPHRGTHPRSSASPGYLAPPSDRGGRMQWAVARDREQNSYDRRRDLAQGDFDDDHHEDTPRSRAGGHHGASPRSRPREYDDEYEYTHNRYG